MQFRQLLPTLENLPLFYKISSDDILALLDCMGASVKTYQKGESILTEGQDLTGLLILLKGSALLYKNADLAPSLIDTAREGHVLGAASIGRDIVPSMMSATAATRCVTLSIPFRRLMYQCNRSCPFHHKMVENLVISISEEQRKLYEKIYILSQKTIREKLLTFLQETARSHGTSSFTLPYGRTELAHYLCADRSALTRELNRLQQEGILSFRQNTYSLSDKIPLSRSGMD
ncbi:MAG: Crp/Fnr family transcriptional regulator [Lachnospiraceae bacterium]|jgi:CRP-like cAMP-binding protein|nr:Crp/Fnr family transcriptional regulator [Lachnospiraceae bacterium]